MGRILTVRVLAQTYDEAEVRKAWPTLIKLASPDDDWKAGPEPLGVQALVVRLNDMAQFAQWPERVKAALEKPIARAASTVADLDEALAQRDPKRADSLTYSLENLLDDLERDAREAQ